MSLESIVSVVIQSTGGGITQKSFGIPMIAGYHTAYGQRAKLYDTGSVLADLVTDGIPSTHPIYRAARSVAQASPKPAKIVVGRLTGSHTQEGTIEIIGDPVEGDSYAFTVRDASGVPTTISYTVLLADTTTDVALALAALLTAVSGITATSLLAVITFDVDTATETWTFEDYSDVQIALQDTTPAPIDVTLAADYASIKAVNSDWYGMAYAGPQSKVINLALAAEVEADERIFMSLSHDADNRDPASVASLMYAANAAGYYRTAVMYSADQKTHAGASWMGEGFPYDPGSSTWCYKVLKGTTIDLITADGQGSIDAVNGNHYTKISGLSVTQTGKMSGGEWIDIVIFRDWVVARLREYVFTLLSGTRKVPFTDPGVELVKKEVKAVLTTGVNRGGFAADPAPEVTAPKVADVATADKLNRILPDVRFTATFAGAIHAVKLTGTLIV